MRDLETIKKRVRKLLALSKSSNEYEALSALKKAQSLMQEYELTPTKCSAYTMARVKATKRVSKWRSMLALAMEELYTCKMYRSPSTSEIVFYGEELDVFMAKEMYEYLSKTIDRMVKQNVRKSNSLKYKNEYRYGIASRIAIEIEELGEKASWRNEERKNKKQMIKHASEKELSVGKTETYSFKTSRAFNRGMDDGKNISLHRQATCRQGYLEE